jgi:isopenicillin-N epimerase
MTRRDAVASSALAASLFGLPANAAAGKLAPIPKPQLHASDPEAFWKKVRDQQFLLPPWRSFLNNGSLGIAPRPVVAHVSDYLARYAALDVTEYPRWGYETMDAHRETLAAFVGCRKDELALLHNATEGLSLVANGVDLNPGDEVVMTSLEHPSGKAGWAMRAKRHGISVREVDMPSVPKNPGELAGLMTSAIGPRTRVLFFSGIFSPTGWIMPVREICDAARAKGVITVVDGAHMHGQIPLKISDLNCDYFTGSPHKWMFAPAGCGFLYIREENLDRLWPLTVTGDWDNRDMKAGRFMRLGTNNRAIMEGLIAGMKFGEQIGWDRIYARTHQLARRVLERAKALPGIIELATPDDDRMFGALTTIRFRKDPARFWEETRKRKIWTLEGPQVRISTHIHTRPQDIDQYFDLMQKVLG